METCLGRRAAKVRRLMSSGHFFGEVERRLLEKVWNPAVAYVAAHMLEKRNRTNATPITGDAPVVVSLTTYGARFETVHLTIESIARGTRRPGRVLLWLDDEAMLEQLSSGLQRLISRGLEIGLTPNYGPHKKYYPTITRNLIPSGHLLVTCDDDVVYPRRWLEMLLAAATESPGEIICHRARTIGIDGDAIAPYSSWSGCWTTSPSLTHFATGVSGVLYPDSMVARLRELGTKFIDSAPRADDVWLNATATELDLPTRQVRRFPRSFPSVPGSQSISLAHDNVDCGQNDVQIAKSYSAQSVHKLTQAVRIENSGRKPGWR